MTVVAGAAYCAADGAGRDDRVEQSGAVEVHGAPSDRARERLDVRDVERRPARGHVRVLEGHHRHVRLVVVLRVDDVEHVAQCQRAVRVVHGGELDGGVARGGAHLEADDVLAPSGDHEVAGTGEYPHGDLVAHDARGHEERGLLAHEGGESFLQRLDRRVLVVPVVADDRRRHRVAHRLGRLRDGVAS